MSGWVVSLSSSLKYHYQVFCGHFLAPVGRGRKNKACGWLMRCLEVTWSAAWGLSKLLQPGKGDAEPQTSGVFRVHHSTSLPGSSHAVQFISHFLMFYVLGFLSVFKVRVFRIRSL